MSRPKHTRRDANHAEIVKDLNDLGAHVIDCADLGGEVLDLVVCWRGICLPVEIKSKDGKLTIGERVGIAKLRTVGVEALVVYSMEDFLDQWPETTLAS